MDLQLRNHFGKRADSRTRGINRRKEVKGIVAEKIHNVESPDDISVEPCKHVDNKKRDSEDTYLGWQEWALNTLPGNITVAACVLGLLWVFTSKK